MILHPGVLALLTGSGCLLALLAVASWHAAAIVRRWDFSSSSAGQLALERKTHLVSTVVAYGLGFQLLSAPLFVHTVDELHPLVVGAMCATGVLNANPVGWAALAAKLALTFATALWLALHAVDRRAEDYPLCRPRFALLLGLAPLVALDLGLQAGFFLGLRPDVITSCCGALFTPAGEGLASTLAALPPGPTVAAFYGSAGAFLVAAGLARWRPGRGARAALGACALGFLPVALAAVVSAVAPYVYESPTHHCPFDLLQAGYGYVGYPIYLALGVAVYYGVLPALFDPLKRVPSLAAPLEGLKRRWAARSAAAQLFFLGLVTASILRSHLTLLGPL